MQPNVSLKRDATFAVFALGVVAATSILGQMATYPNLVPWYAGLAKPSFNPPNWIFAPVWTALYALMAFALFILRAQKPSGMQRRYAVGLFLLVLALNAAWSWMFFWAHSPLLGLMNIVPQFVVILATVVSFAQLGGNLFAPIGWMGSIRGDTQYRDLAIKRLTDLTIRSPSVSPLAQSGIFR
jgi:translocator protein